MKKRFLFPLFLAMLGPGAAIGAEHVWFPDWKVSRVSQAKLTDWDLAKAFRKKSGRRTDISLNGFWKFTLCEKIRDTPPPLDKTWGFFLVPGFWRVGPQCNFIRSSMGNGFPFHFRNGKSALHARISVWISQALFARWEKRTPSMLPPTQNR